VRENYEPLTFLYLQRKVRNNFLFDENMDLAIISAGASTQSADDEKSSLALNSASLF